MNYTKKQIESGFERWETDRRLHPETFFTEEDQRKLDISKDAKVSTKTLIEYINN